MKRNGLNTSLDKNMSQATGFHNPANITTLSILYIYIYICGLENLMEEKAVECLVENPIGLKSFGRCLDEFNTIKSGLSQQTIHNKLTDLIYIHAFESIQNKFKDVS